MAVTHWLQAAHTRRNDAWYQQVAAQLATPDTLYITADASMARATIARILGTTSQVLWGDTILAAPQWLALVADDTQAIAPYALRLALVHDILRTSTLSYYTHIRDDLHCAAHMLRGIDAVLTTGLHPDHVALLARHYGLERERDLAVIYTQYHSRLHELNYVDPAATAERALAQINNGTAAAPRCVMFETGFTPSLRSAQVLATLHERARCDMHVILPAGLTAENAPAPLRNFLRALPGTQREVSANELIENHTAAPQLFCAASPQAEGRWLMQRCGELIADGTRPEHIAIVACNPALIAQLPHYAAECALQPPALQHVSLRDAPLTAQWEQSAAWEQAPRRATLPDWLDWWALSWDSPPISIPDAPLHARRARHEQAWQDLWLELSLHHEAFPDTIWQQAQFRDLLRLCIRAAHLASPRSTESIPCYHIGESLAHTTQHLFFAGATDQHLPRIARREFFARAPIDASNDVERALLDAFPHPETQHAIQQLQYREMIQQAEQVYASFAASSDGMREQHASHYVARSDVEQIDSVLPSHPVPQAPLGTSHVAVRKSMQRATHERELLERIHDESPQQLLCDPGVRAHIVERYAEHTFSVTELETYLRCPYSFFAHYLLALRAEPEASDDVIPTTRGQLIHKALATIYSTQTNTLRNMTHDEVTQLATSTLRHLQQNARALLEAHHPILTDLALHDMTERVVQCILQDQAHWQSAGADLYPAHYELRFGDTEPIIIQHAGNALRLRGSIDRIDIDHSTGSATIVDYKLGRGQGKAIGSLLRRGEHLQLPLYIAVAQQLFPELHVRGGLLYHLADGTREHGIIQREYGKSHYEISGRKGSSMTPEQWDHAMQCTFDHASTAITQITQGIVPLEPHHCIYCDWIGHTRG